MTVSQKVLCCFLLAALLFAGITALAITGIFDNYGGVAGKPAEIPVFVAIFLTLFLINFFCFNLRQDSAQKTRKIPLPPRSEYEELEELEAVSADSMSADMLSVGFTSAEAVQVEAVTGLGGSFFMFRQPFTFTPGNPELLQGTENADMKSEVVYEKNGIHYINSALFADDERKEEINRNFAELVESVVNQKELV